MMGLLYNVETRTINYHLKKIFADGEIDENSVIRKFRITAADGKTYNTNHYNLSAIIAVGNKVDSPPPVVGIGYIVFLSQLLLYDRLDDAFQ